MSNIVMNTITNVVSDSVENILKKKNMKKSGRFHFVVTREMFNYLREIKYVKFWKWKQLVKKTKKLLYMIVDYLSRTKLRLRCIPKGDDPLSAPMVKHLNIKMPNKFYRRLKNSHHVTNSFSIAQVVRIYFTVMIILVETLGIDGMLDELNDAKKDMKELLIKLNKEFRCVQMNRKKPLKRECTVVFDKLYYPIYTEFG